MTVVRSLVPLLLGLSLSLLTAPGLTAPVVPTGFVVENAVPGTTFDTPTGIAFLPDGRLLVAEKKGTVWLVQNGTKLPTPFWSRPSEVLNAGDRGLLDVAVHPDFAANRYVYFLYTVDPDSNGSDSNDDAFGRLTRYQASASNPNVADPATRGILFGATWAGGPASGSITHTIGSLRWGTDKTLLVSVGEGAQFSSIDQGGRDPNLFLPGRTDPSEDIGAFRSQYLGSLAGKILRINPEDGQGYASNPFHDGNLGSVRSRVWAYGLRNPFRFSVRPGSGAADPASGDPGSVYVGDVGWENWEELSVATQGGHNFGWPCYEGLHDVPAYQSATPSHHGCGTIGTPDNPSPHTPPRADWNHWNQSLSSPAGYKGNSASGSCFYSGASYPSAYQGAHFFADYGEGWMRAATVDANDNVIQYLPFATALDGPVDLVTEPGTGNLVYVSINTGEVRRIRYVGGGAGNNAPNAVAGGNPSVGPVPLTVSFSSSGSTDPDLDPLAYTWTFGDGYGSTQSNPIHTYGFAGTYKAKLVADDGRGGTDSAEVIIVAGETASFPTTPVLDDFNRPDGPVGSPWVDPVFGINSVQISNGAMVQPCCNYASPLWNGGVFGPNQEAFITLNAVTTNAPEHDLMLKLQGSSPSAAHAEVRYDARFSWVQVATYQSPGPGWVNRGSPISITFAAGDQLGARAYANGQVDVYKNGILIGSRSLGDWPFAASGGRIGLTLDRAYSSRLDDFGGGTYQASTNTAPLAVIVSPVDSSFYVAGQVVSLLGDAIDGQEPDSVLTYRWDVTLHHNNHQHPGAFVSDNRNDVYTPEDHEDGTGTWQDVILKVTDSQGLSDTLTRVIFPEVDLQPSAVSVIPDPARNDGLNTFTFRLHNRGRMLTRSTRWALRLSPWLLAEGDTVVAPLDSVTISRAVAVPVPAGSYTLRLVADTLAVARETSETNNVTVRPLEVMQGTVAVQPALGAFELSQAIPNPSAGKTAFRLQLAKTSRVDFTIHDVQGRRVWKGESRELGPGRWSLEWDGRGAHAGVYMAHIRVDGDSWVRRFALVR